MTYELQTEQPVERSTNHQARGISMPSPDYQRFKVISAAWRTLVNLNN